MTEDRVARGCRVAGQRRLRRFLLASMLGLALAGTTAAQAQANPFAGRGMWIWVLGSSNGGSLSSIIRTAHQTGLSTLMIKSGDGGGTWSQFNSGVVSALHGAGLHVCGWQYVYGSDPIGEASVGAAAVRDGADCLVIDAESEYEGKYVQAQQYIGQLRKLIGNNFPVALAGFPYVDYHPAFPYSVFLGPGGAQYNTPQMYWVDIGTTVAAVYAHTYVFNRIYQRPISPLGQIYNNPPSSQVRAFRSVSIAYGASGVSWWDWQEANSAGWHALSQPVGPIRGYVPDSSLATVGLHAQGDVVVWAQEHLISSGYRIKVDGGFGPATQTAVEGFQRAHGLAVDGVIGPATWSLLLRYAPASVRWTSSGAKLASAGFSLTMQVPKSARLKAKHNEIPSRLGAGRP